MDVQGYTTSRVHVLSIGGMWLGVCGGHFESQAWSASFKFISCLGGILGHLLPISESKLAMTTDFADVDM